MIINPFHQSLTRAFFWQKSLGENKTKPFKCLHSCMRDHGKTKANNFQLHNCGLFILSGNRTPKFVFFALASPAAYEFRLKAAIVCFNKTKPVTNNKRNDQPQILHQQSFQEHAAGSDPQQEEATALQ
jgi:hypothetical protein